MTYFRLIFAALLLCLSVPIQGLSVPIQAMAQENGLKKSALHPHCRHAILERAKFEKTCVSNIKSGACSKIKAWIQKTDEYLEQHCSVPSTYLYGVEDLIPDIDVEDVIEGLDDEIDDIDPNSEDKPNDEEPNENGGDSDESGDEVDNNPPERCITGENASTGITEYGEEHPAEIGTANRDAGGYACFKKPLDDANSIISNMGLNDGHATFARLFKIRNSNLSGCASSLSGQGSLESCNTTPINPEDDSELYYNCMKNAGMNVDEFGDMYILDKAGSGVDLIIGSSENPYRWQPLYDHMYGEIQSKNWADEKGSIYPDNTCNLDKVNGVSETVNLDKNQTFVRFLKKKYLSTSLSTGEYVYDADRDTGRYFTTPSASWSSLSLPGSRSEYCKVTFKLKEVRRVEKSTVSAWFGQSGGGIQFFDEGLNSIEKEVIGNPDCP